jgi:mRNA degradation ribonuclease J1/J2
VPNRLSKSGYVAGKFLKIIGRQIHKDGVNLPQMNVSGHMSKEQLVEMIKEIQPKQVFPVHTENQQLFKTYCKNIQTVKQGFEYAPI